MRRERQPFQRFPRRSAPYRHAEKADSIKGKVADLEPLPQTNLATALDWLSLAKEALADTKPLTSEERASINEFFWSHFQ